MFKYLEIKNYIVLSSDIFNYSFHFHNRKSGTSHISFQFSEFNNVVNVSWLVRQNFKDFFFIF